MRWGGCIHSGNIDEDNLTLNRLQSALRDETLYWSRPLVYGPAAGQHLVKRVTASGKKEFVFSRGSVGVEALNSQLERWKDEAKDLAKQTFTLAVPQVRAWVCVSSLTHTYTHPDTHTHTLAHTSIHTHIHMHKYTCTHTHLPIHAHTSHHPRTRTHPCGVCPRAACACRCHIATPQDQSARVLYVAHTAGFLVFCAVACACAHRQ